MRLCNDIKLNSTKSKTMVTILFVNLIKNSPYHYYQFRKKKFRQHKSYIIFFLSRTARIFFPEFNITLYDKNSESDFFFPSTKIRIFLSATLGIRICFRKKPYPPPLQVKWQFPYDFCMKTIFTSY